MPIEQIIVLALIQGITEFLPISSSGHLILVPLVTGGRTKGVMTDVMTHMGSLPGGLVYFWRDILACCRRRVSICTARAHHAMGATGPVDHRGHHSGRHLRADPQIIGLSDHGCGRGTPAVIAWNAIIFGILMYLCRSLWIVNRRDGTT